MTMSEWWVGVDDVADVENLTLITPDAGNDKDDRQRVVWQTPHLPVGKCGLMPYRMRSLTHRRFTAWS